MPFAPTSFLLLVAHFKSLAQRSKSLVKTCERHFLCCLVGGQLWIPKKVVTNAFADVCKASFHLTSISKPNWTGVDGAPSGETLARAIGTNLANSTGHIDSHLLSFLGSGRKAEYTFLIS